ncbi:MAG: hypothetical protein B7Z78_03995 [Rhodospirillales bacterium 20-60-12]|nr:MAG: hypothetical protein B7Z78_03995 [Rhodospirillales bacterium 20-60-12]HQT67893.1 YdcF family protein [Acetobacteraceae bacterium]
MRPRRRRRGGLPHIFRFIMGVCVVLAGLWAAGFVLFAGLVASEQPPNAVPHADGIVVLTGGKDRVRAGLSLLVARAAPRLLISGAGVGTYLGDFTPRDGIDAAAFAAGITLGHQAISTVGNAIETAHWVAQYHLTSLIVVTADYHMPRALFDLHKALPGIALIAWPVKPPAMTHFLTWSSLQILAEEYTKYVAVRLGLGAFAAHSLKVLAT